MRNEAQPPLQLYPMQNEPDFKAIFDAAPMPQILLASDDPIFTVVAANDEYLRVTGIAREKLIGSPAAMEDGIAASLRKAIATRLPDRSQYFNICNTPLLDASGEVRFVVQSIDRQSIDRQSIDPQTAGNFTAPSSQAKEQLFGRIAETSGIGLLVANRQGGISYANSSLLALLGYTEEEVAGGLLRWDSITPTELLARDFEAWQEVIDTGRCVPYETVYIAKNGTHVPILMGASLLHADGAQAEVAAFAMDLTSRKWRELDSFLIRLEDATRTRSDPREITRNAARLVVESLRVNGCAYAEIDNDEDTTTVTGEYSVGIESIAGRYTLRQFGEQCRALLREGQAFVVNDSETDARTDQVREAYRATQIRSVICIPLRKGGRLVASISIYQITPRLWRADEIELVRQVASRCWESIERVRVTRELREREQRYRFLAESIPQMVWTARPDGGLDYVNGQVSRYFGTNLEGVLGSGWLRWVHREDQARTIDRWTHSLTSNDPYESAFRLLRDSDRTYRWHLARAEPLIHDGGAVQWFGTCTDIEDQKQAEDRLRQQWRTFDSALSHTKDHIYSFDLEGKFTYANQALIDLFRLPREQIVGKNFYQLEYPKELADRLTDQLKQVRESGETVRDHEDFTGGSGETGHYEHIFSPIFSETGEVQGVAGSSRDMTERNQIAKALAASEEKLRETFAQAPVAICVFRGKNFVVESANPTYQALLPGRQLVGRPFADAVPELGREVWEILHRVVNTGEQFVASEMLIPYDRNGDGVIRDVWFNAFYHPLRDAAGNVSGMVAVCTDVSIQVKARKELERVNREMEEFAYVASHDLQEPLRMVNIYSQLLIRELGPSTTGDPARYADFIHVGVRRMEELIRDLLCYSQTTHTMNEAGQGRADLDSALGTALKALATSADESGAVITAEPLPAVAGNETQIAHVFLNLLGNAIKYRKAGGVPQIRITAERRAGEWLIAVKDNGIGFEQAQAAKVFGLFKRLHRSEQYPGTGLGLAICKRIIERYRGRIWAESEPGVGSTFFFALPVPERD